MDSNIWPDTTADYHQFSLSGPPPDAFNRVNVVLKICVFFVLIQAILIF